MVKKEKPTAIIMTDGKREIIRQLLSEYDIQTAQDIQEALKDLHGGTSKRIKSGYGNFNVEVPQDRKISDTIEELYGFEVSDSFVSDVTDKILSQIQEWQTRPLEEVYQVVFVDAIH